MTTEHELILKNQLVLLRLLKVEYISGFAGARDRREWAEKYVSELGVDDQIKATQEFISK